MGPFSHGSIITQAQKQSLVPCSVIVSLFLLVQRVFLIICLKGSSCVFITCKYLPKLRKFMLLFGEEFCVFYPQPSPSSWASPTGWWGPCEVRQEWFGAASCELLTRIMTLLIHYCRGRAHVNDKLTSNPTNKLPPRIGNWFCGLLSFDNNRKAKTDRVPVVTITCVSHCPFSKSTRLNHVFAARVWQHFLGYNMSLSY